MQNIRVSLEWELKTRMMKRVLVTVLLAMVMALSAAYADEQTITLTCLGDILLGSNDPVSTREYAFHRYIERFGLSYPFERLMELTASDDITLANLECVFNDGAEIQKSRYRFRGPVSFASILSAGSIEAVNLANNHSDDYGAEGYQSTVKALENAGILFSGSTSNGNTVSVWEKDGIRIGFVGVIPLHYRDHAKEVADCFEELKAAGCQVIVASLHAGKEYSPTHGSMQERYGRILRSLGAKIIIGHHPHVPQGIDVTDGVTQLYSLGNASFGGNTGVDEKIHSLISAVAQFELRFRDGIYLGHQLTLWPIHISGTTPENNYQPVLVSGDEAQAVMKRIQKDTRFKLKVYVDGQGARQDFIPWGD